MNPPSALSVSAVVSFLREVLEANEFFSDLWIQGEVSNYSRSQVGHRYFSLKDANAALRTVLFRDNMSGFQLKDGERVIAHGRITIYPQRGELQFVADFVRPEGVGILAAKFEELRLRLEAEGLFDPGRKRPLPRFPRTIGLVTSPTGAALQDIRNVLARRWPLATILLSPALVQGEQAAGQVTAALRRLAKEPALDLAIVARGGGSAEDLSAFNDERVARAIYGFPVPVVLGVGHETDVTIADLVADLRAPTPSAAAERAVPDAAQMEQALRSIDRQMASVARGALAEQAGRVESQLRRIQYAAPDPVGLAINVRSLVRDMQAGLERRCAADRARFENVAARIDSLNPMATLARGFAIVQKELSGKKPVVNSARKVKPGDRLSVSVADGAFWAEVS
ncbi:MAG: exodeoxyribonuclease VII large subunit [Dehalococcoidia bacterium]|uniref:exodeoxyribonuclease VII large subunit n=1 Tax=Candidatus Amarobacter glycogenicus TaxID=3140699 RepID=UPI003134FFAB|nr:exodeoxyribonuclease VII large subunit [Dehalococcoidia bacterium]